MLSLALMLGLSVQELLEFLRIHLMNRTPCHQSCSWVNYDLLASLSGRRLCPRCLLGLIFVDLFESVLLQHLIFSSWLQFRILLQIRLNLTTLALQILSDAICVLR